MSNDCPTQRFLSCGSMWLIVKEAILIGPGLTLTLTVGLLSVHCLCGSVVFTQTSQ